MSRISKFRARSLLTCACLLAALLAAAIRPAGAFTTEIEERSFTMSRAINVAQWFTWPRYLADGRGIAWPPYKTTPAPPSDAELLALREAGFDTVRLPVDPAPFTVFAGRRREAVYGMLFDAMKRIRAAGLNVIVDIHPNSQHRRWGQDAVIAGTDTPAFRAVAQFAEEMARRLKGPERAWVALELLNEPRLKCEGPQQAQWQRMAQHLVKRARQASPNLALIVSGACISSIDGLLALDPAPFHDANMFYTFHFYEPFTFSHQGAQFIPWADKYLDGVPWPPSARPISEPLKLMNKHVMGLPKLDEAARNNARRGALGNLRRFYADGHGRETVNKRFAELRRWAERHKIAPSRILNGEFGVIRRAAGTPGALCEDRLRWLNDVRQASEANGFAWAYFNYDGPFALAEGEGKRLDPGVLAALGLKSACPAFSGEQDYTASTPGGRALPPSCCTAAADE